MMKNKTLRIVLLSAGLMAGAFTSVSRAAEDAAPAPAPAPADKPATPPADAPQTRRSRFDPADMLKNYRDRFEGLNLTDDQMKKIDGFLTTAETEVKTATSSENREDRRKAFEAMQKLDQDVQSVLTDAQKQAMSQKRRADFFDRSLKTPYTADKLNLTDDQKTKIKGILDDAQKTMAALPPVAAGDQDARRKSYEQIRDMIRDTKAKLDAVLTPDQLKEIPQFGRGGPGGGPGGGRTRTRGGAGGTPPPTDGSTPKPPDAPTPKQ